MKLRRLKNHEGDGDKLSFTLATSCESHPLKDSDDLCRMRGGIERMTGLAGMIERSEPLTTGRRLLLARRPADSAQPREGNKRRAGGWRELKKEWDIGAGLINRETTH